MMLNYCYCVINVYQGIMSFDCFTSVLINYRTYANNECRLIPQKSLSCALESERTPLRTSVSLNENQSMLLKVINRQYIQFVTLLHPHNYGSVTQRFMEKFPLSSLLSIFHAPRRNETSAQTRFVLGDLPCQGLPDTPPPRHSWGWCSLCRLSTASAQRPRSSLSELAQRWNCKKAGGEHSPAVYDSDQSFVITLTIIYQWCHIQSVDIMHTACCNREAFYDAAVYWQHRNAAVRSAVFPSTTYLYSIFTINQYTLSWIYVLCVEQRQFPQHWFCGCNMLLANSQSNISVIATCSAFVCCKTGDRKRFVRRTEVKLPSPETMLHPIYTPHPPKQTNELKLQTKTLTQCWHGEQPEFHPSPQFGAEPLHAAVVHHRVFL